MEIRPIAIAGRKVGPGQPCLIVAEVSANHHQKYEEAEAILRAAKASGADAVKLQTYTPDTMTIDSDRKWFYLGGENTPGSWKDKNLYALYRSAYTPWEWQPKLKKLAEELGLIFFSTPFDATAVEFLEKMGVPCHKIASYEATDIPLLRKVAATGKPVIMSAGFANLAEVEEAIATLREGGAAEIAVLHCVTAYSTDPRREHMNLRTIRDIQDRFGVVSGFSDNNGGITIPIESVYAGASIIEKHFILDRASGGPDSRFSIEPAEFRALVDGVRRAEETLGRIHYGPVSPDEENYRTLRRSLFAVREIEKGETFTPENVRVIRPAFGLPPSHYDRVVGKKSARRIERGEPLAPDDIA